MNATQTVPTTRGMRRLVAGTMAAVLALQPTVGAWAANHPNSSIQNVHVVNMTANVDWDYDGAAPTQINTGKKDANGNDVPAVVLSKEVVEKQILREYARKLYLMTEGRHRVGTVYVYKNSRFKNSVDLQILNQDGRSNGGLNAWQSQAGTTTNYLSISGNADTLMNFANVLAHETGHYMYGLMDEYREEPAPGATRTASARPSSPGGFDTTKATMMSNHELGTRLSVAEDYAVDVTRNNTAQARVYATDAATLRGGSAWEVLTRDPANDPPQARESGTRIFYDAFKGFSAATLLNSLTKYFGGNCVVVGSALAPIACRDDADVVVAGPSGGNVTLFDQRIAPGERVTTAAAYQSGLWQKAGGSATQDAADGAAGTAFENFKVVWADSSNPTPGAAAGVARNAIVINRGIGADATFQQALDTAVGLVNRAPAGTQLAIVATPAVDASGAGQGASADVVQGLTAVDTGKAGLIAAIRGLRRVADSALALEPSYDKFMALATPVRQVADTVEVFVISDNSGASFTPSKDFATRVRADRVPFTITELMLPGTTKAALKRSSLPADVARALGVSTTSASLLSELARATGGHLNTAKSSEEAIKEAQRASEFSAGKSPALVGVDEFDVGAKGGANVLSFKTTVHDNAVTVKWYFDPVDAAKVSFKLTSPTGVASTALAAESDLADGYAVITVASPVAAGQWRAEVAYKDTMTEGVSAEALTDSAVQMTASLTGGTASASGKPPVLQARLAGNYPVAGAQVTADIVDLNTAAVVLSGVTLKDDGLGADARANDGNYAVDLANKLPAGEYVAVVTAVTVAGTLFQPNQVFLPGPAVLTTIPVGSGLVRLEQVEFTLEAGSTGVAAAATTSTPTATGNQAAADSGGCTVVPGQNDMGLVVLLLAALTGMALRRKARREMRRAARPVGRDQ